MRRNNTNKWVSSPAALAGAVGVKRDWRTLIAHRSPEIRALFEALEAHAQAARLEGGPRRSAKLHARQAAAAAAKGAR